MAQAITSIKKGDTVKVMVGKERGKIGKVLRIDSKKGRLFLEKINLVKRHTRPTQQNRQGGIVEKEASLNVSNVMIMCDKCNVPVRIKMKVLKDKTKARACVKCEEIFKSK